MSDLLFLAERPAVAGPAVGQAGRVSVLCDLGGGGGGGEGGEGGGGGDGGGSEGGGGGGG